MTPAARSALLLAIAFAAACAVPGSSTPEPEFEVEKPPALIPVVQPPQYPRSLLEAAGTTAPAPGRVVVRLTVRVDGTVDPNSISVVSASDSAFIAPVLAVVPTWRFLPAERGPVRGPFRKFDMEVSLPVIVTPPAKR